MSAIDNPYKKVFITGAGGFIAKKIADWYQENGSEICGIDFVADPNRGTVKGDLTKPEQWQHMLEGVDLVLHSAAVVSNTASTDFAWQVNVKATADLIDLAAGFGVKRFLHLSSAAAFGFKFPFKVTEDHPVKMNGNPYTDSKIASEHVVLSRHAAGKIAATIIRPTDVYGPGSRPWVVLPIEMLKKGEFVLPSGDDYYFSPIFIDDLVAGTVFAANKDEGAGHIFTIGGGIEVSPMEFFGNHSSWIGATKPIRTVNITIAKVAAQAMFYAAKLMGKQSEMGAETVNMLSRNNGYSIAKAEALLGWTPQVSLEDGLAQTKLWAEEQGLL